MSIIFATERPGNSGERYDLADFINPAALSAHQVREDATTTAFFVRDLTQVMERTFDVKYPDLKARQLFPVWTGVDPGAEGYVWRQYDRVGGAALIHDYSADLPSTEIAGQEFMSRCLSLGTSYNYSIQDLRKARMAGIPLETRKALAARRSMEQAFEQIAFFGVAQFTGSTTLGSNQGLWFAPAAPSSTDPLAMYGVTNFPAIASLGLLKSITNDWTNSATTVQTIVDDFNSAFLQVINQSGGVHTADTAVLPLSLWALLQQKPRSATFTEDSVLQYIQKLNPWLKNVYWTPMLETASTKQDNTTPGPMIIVYERSEENIQLVVPQEFEQLPPQVVNLTFKVPCHMRVGGMRVSYPKAFCFLKGMAG